MIFQFILHLYEVYSIQIVRKRMSIIKYCYKHQISLSSTSWTSLWLDIGLDYSFSSSNEISLTKSLDVCNTQLKLGGLTQSSTLMLCLMQLNEHLNSQLPNLARSTSYNRDSKKECYVCRLQFCFDRKYGSEVRFFSFISVYLK